MDYIEDEGVWSSGAEQRVLRPWVGQTEFLAAQSDEPDGPVVAHLRDYSKLSRVWRAQQGASDSSVVSTEEAGSRAVVPECERHGLGGPRGPLEHTRAT